LQAMASVAKEFVDILNKADDNHSCRACESEKEEDGEDVGYDPDECVHKQIVMLI